MEKNDDLTSESMYSLTLLNEHLIEWKTNSYMAGMQAFYTTTKGTYLGVALTTQAAFISMTPRPFSGINTHIDFVGT